MPVPWAAGRTPKKSSRRCGHGASRSCWRSSSAVMAEHPLRGRVAERGQAVVQAGGLHRLAARPVPLGPEPARDPGHLAAPGHDEVAAVRDRGPDPGPEEGTAGSPPAAPIGLEDDRPGIVEERGGEQVGDGRGVARDRALRIACIRAVSPTVALLFSVCTLHNIYASRRPRRAHVDAAAGAVRPAHRDRAAGSEGTGPRRVRPRVDEPQPAARVPDRPGPRRGLRDRGHRRQRVPRLRRRHRGQLDRPQPPGRRRRDPGAGREPHPHVGQRLLPADLRPGGRGARAHLAVPRPGPRRSSATAAPRRSRPASSSPGTTPAART